MAWNPVRHLTDVISASLELVRADIPMYLAIAAYTVAGLLLLDLMDSRGMIAHALYVKQWATMFLFLMPVIALSIEAIYVIHRFDKRRGLAFRRAYSPRRIAYL